MYFPRLEHVALTLALDDRVRVLARRERRAGRKTVEEVAMDVERVDRVELDDVDEVDPDELAALDANRLVHEVEGNGVDCVDLVVFVEVRIERVLNHHELVGVGTTLGRVDDERAVQAFRDVPRERRRVAVVQMQPERLRLELVGELLADVDEAAADLLKLQAAAAWRRARRSRQERPSCGARTAGSGSSSKERSS